jgi:hypothetical protein
MKDDREVPMSGHPKSSFKRQRCSACKCQDKFNFYVPDEIWREIVPVQYLNKVVCLQCFDEFARKKNIDYSHSIDTLYFAGSQATFKFHILAAAQAERSST